MLPVATAKSYRRASAHSGGIRHGHDPAFTGRASRDARLAYRQRGKMWSCWDHFFYLDGRMVHGRAGNYRLGIWDRYAGTPTEEGVLHAGRETGSKQFHLASSSLAEGAVRFGNCLFVQWWPDSCIVP